MDKKKKEKKRIWWVCQDCGSKALKQGVNKHCKQFSLSTWHMDKCDVCGETKPVTEPRDFGFPVFENKKG